MFLSPLIVIESQLTLTFALRSCFSIPNHGVPMQHQMHRDSHQIPNGMPPQGFTYNPHSSISNAPPGLGHSNFVQQEQFLVNQGPPPPLHNPTGSAHFLVNERGEIIGHANHMIQQGMPQPGPNFAPAPNRQRAMSHGVVGSPAFVQQLQQDNLTNMPPFPPFHDSSSQHGKFGTGQMPQMQIGSIGDGRMQLQRQNTDPEIKPALIQIQVSDDSVSSRQSQPRVDSDLSQTNSLGGVEEKEEEPIKVVAPLV